MTKPLNYETLFRVLPERYVVMATDAPVFTILDANTSYLEVTAAMAKEIIGKGMFEAFPDTSTKARATGKGELQESFERVLQAKKPDSTGIIRYDIASDTGELEVRYWQATHYPYMEDGVCRAIVQSTADVTELVQSSEQLRLANLKFEDAFTAGLIGSWSWDVDKDMVITDKGLAFLFGVSPQKAIDGLPLKTFMDAIHEEDREAVSDHITQTLASGTSFEAEYRTVDTSGVVRWVIARGRVERNSEGEPLQFPGVMIDISSRKRAEAELQDSEERLRFMADTMPQLVWITRSDGYHEYYNKQWYAFTGTQEGASDGEGWNDLFHPQDQALARKVWQRSLETGEPYEIKYRLHHAPSDSYRWVMGRALPFKNDKGEIIKWYGTCTDIDDSVKEIEMRKRLEQALKEEQARLESRVEERTSQLRLTNEGLRKEIKKRQRIEQKLREYGEELQRSNKELEEFAYVSSHDLQEPLRKIQAFGDLLVDEHGDKLGEGKEYLDRIQNSAQRMSALIEDLLTFSRVTTKPSTPGPVDLNEIMHGAVADIQDRIEKEGGAVEVEAGLPTVLADEVHMRQLFQNLLSNGLKFHPKDRAPVVKVRSKKTDDGHVITIEDNGIGIEERHKERIFAVFQRLNTKQAFDGTGIGLAVCKKIIERYGGTITIESVVGTGTTFHITLPHGKEV